MQTRKLGRTGNMSSIIIMGTAAFTGIDQAGADEALDLAASRGVNHIDVAPQYGKAQQVVGPWLASRRDQFFLGCKTLERSASAAWEDLQNSLRLLHTGHFDLYQLHAITGMDELDKAFVKGGAMETLRRAKAEGLTRFLGITGHGLNAPAVFIEALGREDFDTVMFPLNPQLYANEVYRRSAERLLRLCQDRDVGVMIIKSVAKGPWGSGERQYNTWYHPHDTPEGIARGVRFALSQPGVTALPSAGDVTLLPLVLDAAEHYTPMSEAEQADAIAEDGARDPLFVPGMFASDD